MKTLFRKSNFEIMSMCARIRVITTGKYLSPKISYYTVALITQSQISAAQASSSVKWLNMHIYIHVNHANHYN